LIRQGDLADYFYVIQHGKFVLRQEDGQGHAAVQVLTQGDSFGELALLYPVPRNATVQVQVESTVWVIDRRNFKQVLMMATQERITQYMRRLDTVDLLSPLSSAEKRLVAGALVEKHFREQEPIIRQGEPGSTFFILIEGEVAIRKDNREVSRLMADPSFKTTICFGERALLENEPRAATIEVSSAYAKTLSLEREAFDLLTAPARARSNNGHGPLARFSSNIACRRMLEIPFDQLCKVGLLGCGQFGTVELVEHMNTEETYALKGISKGFIVRAGARQSVMNEKLLMSMVDSPFIIKLFACYNRTHSLFFLMEAALGGELFTLYNQHELHGLVPHARFYSASVLCALDHLHERHIIYRDLKPENLLLDDGGWLKLTDFGLAKYTLAQTYTTCGTPEYFAPEVIESTGHTEAVDWWALGVIIFEWLAGYSPFEAESPMEIFKRVRAGIDVVDFPQHCKGDVGDLIKAVLRHPPSERLPCLLGGTDNVRTHAWFRDFDWNAFANHTMEPPFRPSVANNCDLGNFFVDERTMPIQLPYFDDDSGWDDGFES